MSYVRNLSPEELVVELMLLAERRAALDEGEEEAEESERLPFVPSLRERMLMLAIDVWRDRPGVGNTPYGGTAGVIVNTARTFEDYMLEDDEEPDKEPADVPDDDEPGTGDPA